MTGGRTIRGARLVVRASAAIILVTTASLLAACSSTASQHAAAASTAHTGCSAGLNCKVALIISDAGLGDKGFNDLGYAGLKRAIKDFGVTGTPVQDPQIDTHCTQDLTSAAQAGYGLIVNLNYGCETSLVQVAKQFPRVRFVMVDNVAPGSNVTSEMFDVQDSSFLCGVVASMLNLYGNAAQARGHHVVGAIGGVKSPGIDQFLVGFQQGAQYIDPKAKVLIAYANGFADPSKGAELTKAMFAQGATVVYQVAGVTGLGGIKAAQQAGLFAIGVDSNQDYLAPGHVLTSSIKHTDTAVYDAVAGYAHGALKGNTTLFFGLGNGGVAISPMQYTSNLLPAAQLARLATIGTAVQSGKIPVWNVPTQGYPSWFSGGK